MRELAAEIKQLGVECIKGREVSSARPYRRSDLINHLPILGGTGRYSCCPDIDSSHYLNLNKSQFNRSY